MTVRARTRWLAAKCNGVHRGAACGVGRGVYLTVPYLAGVNLARKLVDDVRRRKGLLVEEKAVKVATKQRTLSKKR